MKDSITVLGAGNSGLAMASHLSLMGYKVCLWNRSRKPLEDILSNDKGTVYVEGVVKGQVKIDLITNDMKEAVGFSKLIMVTTPADAHADIARFVSALVTSDHIVVLNPGRCFGVVDFINILKASGCDKLPVVAETQTILYTCRKTSFNRSLILALKKQVLISSTSRKNTEKVIESLPACIRSYFVPAGNMLETSLGNIGMILHSLPVLMNTGWIENRKTSFKYYYDGITPSISKLLEKMDKERLETANRTGMVLPSLSDWLVTSYGAIGESLFDKLQSVESYKTIEALDTLQHRYIFEDIPFGLVPMESIGKAFKLPMKITALTIELANEIFDFDFRKKGRTLDSLKISIDDILEWAGNEK